MSAPSSAAHRPSAALEATQPLTTSQLGIWLSGEHLADPAAYAVTEVTDVAGHLDPGVWQDAVRHVLTGTTSLRRVLQDGADGLPCQAVDAAPVEPTVVDLRDADDPDTAARDYVASAQRRPIDPRRGMVGEATLLRLTDERAQWVLRMHHLALDGFGFALVARRIAAAIAALSAGDPVPSLDDASDLATFDDSQRTYDNSADADADRRFWSTQCPEHPARAVLTGDGSHTHRLRLVDLDPERGRRAPAELVQPERLLAGAALLARRLTSRTEVVVGVHVLGRADAVAMRTPSTAQNVVPLRVEVNPWDSVDALVEQCRQVWADSKPHHRYRHETLRRDRGLGADDGLADVYVNLTPFGQPIRLPGATARPAPVWEGPVEGLTLGTHPLADGAMTLTLEAPAEAASPAVLRDLAETVLSVAPPLDRPAGSLLRPEDPVEGQPALASPDLDDLITGLAAGRSECAAITDAHGTVAFAQLSDRVAAWADALREHGVEPGTRVGVALPRTSTALAATLGVIAIGGVFVPVDPAWPDARRRDVLEAAGAQLVLSDSPEGQAVPALSPADVSEQGPVGESTSGVRGTVTTSDPAYVLFTSGTTGRPKGVVVPRANLADLVARIEQVLLAPMVRKAVERGRDGRLRWGHNHPFTFDSALSPLAALLLGHEIVLADEETCADPARLAECYTHHQVEALDVAPAMLDQMLDEGFDLSEEGPVVGVVIGGDACSPRLWERLHTATHLVALNDYGPTECTVGAVTATVGEHPTATIGHAQPGTYALVLDADLRPCPDGIAGELYLGGTGVAQGYCGLPALTATRFVADPSRPGARLYRTGDRAIRCDDGSLTFLGRADDQLSLRGVRIEPGEVEAALLTLAGATAAAAVVRDDGLGARLVGYVAGHVSDPGEAREHLRSVLPASSVPSVIVPLDHLPLTSRGKIDRAALPAPTIRLDQGRPFAEMSVTEQRVAEAYAEVLDLPAHGVFTDSDLFALGGHSLSAARVVARLDPARAGAVSLSDVFASPTVEGLAGLVSDDELPSAAIEPDTARVDDHPLTAAQRRLWFVDRTAEPPDARYVIPVRLTLQGPVDTAALTSAIGDVVARHAALRTTFHADDEIDVRPQVTGADEARDVLEISEVHDAGALNDVARRPFDLARDLPIRAALHRSGTDAHELMLAIHHIAADGWSLAPLVTDLSTAYEQRRAGAAVPELGSPPEASSTPPPVTDDDLEWWRTHLAGTPEEIDLPGSMPRPAVRSTAGGEVLRTWSAELTDAVERLAHRHGSTPFMVLQATLAALLTRCGADEDVLLGTVSSGRSTVAEERLVTYLANTVVLRTDTSGNPTFAELLGRFRDETVASLSHAHVPFEQVVEAVNPIRSAQRHPLFQIMLVLQNGADIEWETEGLDVSIDTIGTGTAKFDLTVEVDLARTGPARLRLEHATDVLDNAAVERLADWFVDLLERFVAAPEQRLWEQPLARTPQGSSAPKTEPSADTLVDRLETAFATHASRVALTDGEQNITYGELDRRTAQLRDALLGRGVRRGDLVAVAIPRGFDQVVAVVGTLRAGAAYLPLDPTYPLDRLTSTLREGQPRALVVPTAEPSSPLVHHAGSAVIVALDDESDGPVPERQAPRPTDPAYVIFTSGSTGRPKGVRITQRNVVRLLDQTQPWFTFGPDDVWTLFHSYAFDFAVWEMYGALTHGGRLVVVDHDTARSPRAFLELLVREQVTVLNQTPSAFAQLATADQHHPEVGDGLGVRAIVLGGEAMDPAVLPGWFARHPSDATQLVNMYGITETTVHVTYQLVDENTTGRSPVGVPIPDLGVRLLDRGLHPVPPGVVGEIYVTGAGLADGYLGRPDLTATRFVADPYGPAGSRMYRSGDLAVGTVDGRLDFRGRADRQVQLRGFRIELGDVEGGLLQLPEVDQAHARVHRVSSGDERLVAYVVGPDPASADPAELRTALREHLPAQMVPSAIIPIDRMPLTVNGKLDVSALPSPTAVASSTSTRPPSDEREEMLVGLFAELLGLERVGVDDSFFDLGGHSLLAVRLLDRVRLATGTDLSIATLFASPTPALLAESLGSADHSLTDDDPSLSVLLRLRPGSDGPGVFCVHPAGGLSWCYAGLSRQLPAGTGLWGLQARGVTEPDAQPDSLATMADDYIAQIRAVQPSGPYHLVGWSLGGMVAQVMAARLHAAGQQVGVVALLDAYPSQAETGIDEPPEEDALSALLAMGGYEDAAVGDRPMTLAAVAEVFREGGSAMAGLSISTLARLLRTYRNTARILREYAHEPYPGRVDFFRAARAGIGPDHDADEWDPYVTGELVVHDVDCTHREMTQPGPLGRVGDVLGRRLTEDA